MAYFDKPSSGGRVNPVYLKIGGTNYLQIFPTSYHEKHSCALIGSPSEKGQQMMDNKVVQPATVTFTGIVKYPNKDIFVSIINHLIKKRKLENLLCTFYSKAGARGNMIVESIEEIGESNRYDGIEIKVTLKQYLIHG